MRLVSSARFSEDGLSYKIYKRRAIHAVWRLFAAAQNVFFTALRKLLYALSFLFPPGNFLFPRKKHCNYSPILF